MAVPLAGDGPEQFLLVIVLRDESGAAVFEGGPVTVTARPDEAEPEPVAVELEYVGVGADAAAVAILPTPGVVPFGATLLLEADALDDDGEPIAGTPIRWRSVDPARADFPDDETGSLVATMDRGTVDVIAELLTGPADTVSVLVVPLLDDLVQEAVDSLEAALFVAINDFAGADPFDLASLDLFSFQPARDLFQNALDADPTNATAALGLAVTTVLSLEDDPAIRMLIDDWDQWLDVNDELRDLTGGAAPFPPTLDAMQAVVRDVVRPALVDAQAALSTVVDPAFTFTITPEMQGDLPADGEFREWDFTEVLALRGALVGAIALTD
ncbi:MAG: hypothetical protein L0221_19295, partial [Chloroflexi bacterium]|nr:hypothetical protein [Chloroflexota bacterium]